MFILRVNEDITLRLTDTHQSQEFLALAEANRASIQPFMPWIARVHHHDDVLKLIKRDRKRFAEGEAITARIYYRDQLAGRVRLFGLSVPLRIGNIGYWLAQDFRGKGIMTEVVRTMLDYGFGMLGLRKIMLHCATTNAPSKAIAERIGFEHVAVLLSEDYVNGEYQDLHRFRLMRDQWQVRRTGLRFAYPLGDGLELRILQEEHAADLFRLVHHNREHLRPWLPWVDNTNAIQDTLDFIKSGLDQYAKLDGLQLGIWQGDQITGTVGYHRWDFRHGSTEIGYWLGEDFTGQGIMTRAVAALVDYAFEVLNLHRVEIRCAPQNLKSCAIPQRLGFTHEGTLREGQWTPARHLDSAVYAILQQEWKGSHVQLQRR